MAPKGRSYLLKDSVLQLSQFAQQDCTCSRKGPYKMLLMPVNRHQTSFALSHLDTAMSLADFAILENPVFITSLIQQNIATTDPGQSIKQGGPNNLNQACQPTIFRISVSKKLSEKKQYLLLVIISMTICKFASTRLLPTNTVYLST